MKHWGLIMNMINNQWQWTLEVVLVFIFAS